MGGGAGRGGRDRRAGPRRLRVEQVELEPREQLTQKSTPTPPSSGTTRSATALKKGSYTIALSNSFLGNTWRQTMVKVFQQTANQAQKQRLIKRPKVENTADGTATEQIESLICSTSTRS